MSSRKSLHTDVKQTGLRSSKGRIIFALIFTIVHMVLTALTFFRSYTLLLANMQFGTPLSWADKLIVRANEIFQWPLILTLAQNEMVRNELPAYTFYIILALNSLLWSLVVIGILVWVQRLQHPKRNHR